MPTRETYLDIVAKFELDSWEGYRDFDSLLEEQARLVQQYDEQIQAADNARFVHSLDANHCNVWLSNEPTGGHSIHPTHTLMGNETPEQAEAIGLHYEIVSAAQAAASSLLDLGRKLMPSFMPAAKAPETAPPPPAEPSHASPAEAAEGKKTSAIFMLLESMTKE